MGLCGILAHVNKNVIDHVVLVKYLDYVNCKYRKGLIDKLVEKCSEDIDGNEMAYSASYDFLLNKKTCTSCVLHPTLLIIACMIIMGISGSYLPLYCYIKKNYVNVFSY